jgi:hypothetical protein
MNNVELPATARVSSRYEGIDFVRFCMAFLIVLLYQRALITTHVPIGAVRWT